jgi:hypothetical protein
MKNASGFGKKKREDLRRKKGKISGEYGLISLTSF